MQKGYHSFPEIPPSTLLDHILGYDRGPSPIYSIYNMLGNIDSVCKPPLSNYAWDAILDRVHSCALCIGYGLIQFRAVHCLHFTKDKLAKMYPSTDPTCVRCKQAPDTVTYVLDMSQPSGILGGSFQIFRQNLSTFSVDPHPLIGLFSVRPEQSNWSSEVYNVVAFMTLLAHHINILNR